MAYPAIVGVETYQVDSLTGTHSIPLPSGIAPGMLLLMFFEHRSSVDDAPDWAIEATQDSFTLLSRVADGTEGSTATVVMTGTGRGAAVTYLISGWTDYEVGALGTTTDPPGLSPAFGTGDHLWLTAYGQRRSDWSATAPSNYSGQVGSRNASSSAGTRVGIEVATRELAASSEDPGAWTLSGTGDTATSVTVCVAGTAAAPPEVAGTTATVDSVAAVAKVTATAEVAATPVVVAAVTAVALVGAVLPINPTPAVVESVAAVAKVTATAEISLTPAVVESVAGVATIGAPKPAFVWAVIGGVTGATAEVRGELTEPFTSPVLLVSTDNSLTGAASVAGTNTTGDIWSFEVTDLTPDAVYYYGFAPGAVFGSFRTAPVGPKSFTICAASCWNEETGDTRVFAAMAAKNPAVWLALGDYPYIDNTDTSETAYLTAWPAMNAVPAIRDFHANRVTAYTWSDHDYADNNSHGNDPQRPYAQSAYRKVWPSYPLPGSNGEIYHTFVWGRVRVIMLDCFSRRTPDSTTDSPAKTMLGATQLAWLLDTLEHATEPLILINVSEPWIDDTGTYSWGRYTYERATIANAIHDLGLDDRVVFIHGDTHQLAWDDGTNNTAGDGWPPGPPVFCFAPLDSSPSSRAGPYSGGEWHSSRYQYGQIDITDLGGPITATFRGFTVGSGGSETQQFAVTLTFGEPTVTATTARIDSVAAVAKVTATAEITPTPAVAQPVAAVAHITSGDVLPAVERTSAITMEPRTYPVTAEPRTLEVIA